MNYCASCGAGLGQGRYCTNCGAPVAGIAAPVHESSAEQTRQRMPAVAPGPTTSTRYPMYADEVTDDDRVRWAPPPAPGESRTARRPVAWLGAVVLVLLLVAVLGVWLTSGDDGAEDPTQSRPAAAADPDDADDPADDGPGRDENGGSEQPDPADPPPPSADNLADRAEVTGPDPVAPGRDLAGKRVTYSPAGMLDGDPATAYRIAGDASGRVITFTLPEDSEVREVGLVNGYAKTDSGGGRTVDWYPLNRRVSEVQWVFDDGTTVVQQLRSTTDLQTVAVDGVVTDAVELRILDVSEPGTGPLGKDVTAIGEVLLRAAS